MQPQVLIKSIVATMLAGVPGLANPTLPIGTWVNLTPESGSYWCNDVQIAPNNTNVLYACMTSAGPSKSTDGGSTWFSIHGMSTINSPQRIRIDPNDSNHIFTVCGVGGNTGFFETTDGGANWHIPAGYDSVGKIINDYDMYYIDCDPTNFNHILLSYHYYWYGGMDAGVVESMDGGKHCIIHPIPNVSNGGYDVFFLYNPGQNIGNNQTWLYCTQGSVGGRGTNQQGYWRTTNSGGSWTQVTSHWMTHGGTQIYYAKTGVLYASWEEGVMRSPDNGATWDSAITGLNSRYYFSTWGDGTKIYTVQSNGAMYATPETDGATWSLINSKTFSDGVTMLDFDAQNNIMYAAGRSNGVWAIRLGNPTGTIAQKAIAAPSGLATKKNCRLTINKTAIARGAGAFFDVKGRNIKVR
jgi:hypothetical protein